MKRIVSNPLILSLLAISMMLSLSSCEVHHSYPPPGYDNSGIDRDLTGTWELAYVNGSPVYGYETNWLDFYGNGNGMYYYNDGGITYELPFDYYSEYGYDNWLCIYYADGSYAEMNYWFNHDLTILYLEWTSRGRRVTYTYYWVDNMYWDAPPQQFSPTRAQSDVLSLRPGLLNEEGDEN